MGLWKSLVWFLHFQDSFRATFRAEPSSLLPGIKGLFSKIHCHLRSVGMLQGGLYSSSLRKDWFLRSSGLHQVARAFFSLPFLPLSLLFFFVSLRLPNHSNTSGPHSCPFVSRMDFFLGNSIAIKQRKWWNVVPEAFTAVGGSSQYVQLIWVGRAGCRK